MKGKLLIPSILFTVMLSPLFSRDYLQSRVIAADENYIVHVGDSIQVPKRTARVTVPNKAIVRAKRFRDKLSSLMEVVKVVEVLLSPLLVPIKLFIAHILV